MAHPDRDQDFETVRQQALRFFEVEMRDGSKETVSAHFHDAGSEGHFLCFITIAPSGLQSIQRAIHVDLVKAFGEITNSDPMTQHAREQLAKTRLGEIRAAHEEGQKADKSDRVVPLTPKKSVN